MQTKERTRLLYILAAGVLLICCLLAAGGRYNTPGTEETDVPELSAPDAVPEPVPEPEPLTVETLPEVSYADIPADSTDRDVLRYLYGFGYSLPAEGESFGPAEPAEAAAVRAALSRLESGTEAVETAQLLMVQFSGEPANVTDGAKEAGPVGGMTAETAEADTAVTRSGLAALLRRTAVSMGLAKPAETAEETAEDAALAWAVEQGLYRTFAGEELLPDMPVSRMQAAHAVLGLAAMTGDQLAEEIFAALPARDEDSVSRAEHGTLQTRIEAIAAVYGAAGLQVAVVENGQLTDTYSCGWATVETDPMTKDHKIRCASISKVLVGTAAMLLREEGVIDLDTDIGEIWGVTTRNPRYPKIPVTIRTLLTHTSTLTNVSTYSTQRYEEVKERLRQNSYNHLQPGAANSWEYSNYNFGVLGMTLELAAGEYVDDILDRRLFDAMGIDAACSAGDISQTDLLATIYRSNGKVGRGVEEQKELHHGSAAPGESGLSFAGGLTISARDLGKVAALLAGDGRYEGVQLFSEESVALMETCFMTAKGFGQGMPLRWRTDAYGREQIYYHTGSAYGVYNLFSYDPVSGDGVVILTTGADKTKDENGIYAVCGDIAACVYETLARETEPEAPKTGPVTATLAVCGDVMSHMPLVNDALVDGQYDFSRILAGAEPYISGADYAVANFETTMAGGTNYSGYPRFNAPDGLAKGLKKAGFDLLLTANNHSLDKGFAGVSRTLNVLDGLGLAHVGTSRSQEEKDAGIRVVDVGGVSVAFLGWTYGTNGIPLPKTAPYAVNVFYTDYLTKLSSPDWDWMAAELEKARALEPDLIAVMIHWGQEYQTKANRSQRALAEFLLQNGADLVLGGHSHVPQPIEMQTVTLADGSRHTGLVCYSLGNFISSQNDPLTDTTAVLTVELTRDAAGETDITDWWYWPMLMLDREEYPERYALVDIYRELASEELSAELRVKLTAALEDCHDIWGAEHDAGARR